ncbi:MAG: hypothetical protein O7G86_17295 [Gammaproteobacteria bacterium]|nr:hypothetical protein [Gammaproteobacteria bacterium]
MASERMLLILVVVLFSGCAGVGHYIPVVRIDRGEVQTIVTSGSVNFDNRGASGLRNLDFRDMQVDLREITQSLIDALTKELNLQGIAVEDSAAKTVTLAVKGVVVEIEGGGLTFACTVFIDVRLGDGESFFVEAKRSSYASGFNVDTRPTKPLDKALSDASIRILNHPRFLKFFEQGD